MSLARPAKDGVTPAAFTMFMGIWAPGPTFDYFSFWLLLAPLVFGLSVWKLSFLLVLMMMASL